MILPLGIFRTPGAGAGFLLVAFVVPTFAAAHEGNDPTSVWFRSLVSPYQGKCCNENNDCFPADDYRPSSAPGGYIVYFRGQYVDVPERDVVRREDNPTGHAILCILPQLNHIQARCFVPDVLGW